MTQSNPDGCQTDEQCNDCGRVFENLAVHHGMTDCGPDSHKSQYQCASCGDTFERYDSKVDGTVYCSSDCKDEGIKTGTVKSCEHCDEDFYRPDCHEGKFCSPECSKRHRRQSDEWSKKHREKVMRRVEVECDVCGTPVERRPSNVRENVYCSDPCLSDGLSEMKLGEKNPNFKHGYRKNPVAWVRNALSDIRWRERSAEVRELADKCSLCGDSVDRLEVHHIIPVVAGGTNEDYNLMPLCPSCHSCAEGVANEYSDDHLLSPVTDS